MKGQLPEQEQRRYISYLLRLWQIWGKRQPVWRGSLESAYTGERRGSASLSGSFAFLDKFGAEADHDSLMVISRVEDGKITEHWMNADALGLVRQLSATRA